MRRVLIYIMAIFFVSSCSKEEYEVIKYVSPTVTKSDGGESIDSISTDKPAPVVDTLKLVSTEYKLANLMVEDKSSITLRFNKPVTASEVVVNPKSHITNVILNPDLSLVTANGDSTLIVSLDMYYGEIYNCCAKVIDKETRKTLPFSFTLNTYADIYEYDGIMWNVISDDERETMWLATEDRSLLNVEDAKPFRISRISIDNPSKPTAYIDLRQEPNVMALNPYNNKLYVGTLIKNDYDRYEKYYDYKIHILNSETLVEEGAFVISQKVTKVWSDGHETYYPDVSPRAMAFTDDGFGVIVLKEYTSQGVQLCYVDCRDGHSLKYDRDCWDFFYRDVKTNYDKKSLIIYCMDTFGPEFYT
ncbi:MAG: hypothetical protein HUK05_08460, partial [Prevotella sp.]|nr:hypothetical protein [Prevotella sp.]